MSEQDKKEKNYLKELAPRLFSKEMDEMREIPEDYFDSLEDQVIAKIKKVSEHKPSGKVRSLINFRNLSVAAGLALLLALVPLLKDNNVQNSSELMVSFDHQLNAISEDAASLYLAEEYDLEAIAADIELDEAEVSSNEDLTEEEILNYLLDSEISESVLYESL
ncbi:hypothetical protein O3Q51_06280 [Cryomorphaceae bacterium 1068]|nr:hypothetical protein [Cryomorphaceae bacterium 1068]